MAREADSFIIGTDEDFGDLDPAPRANGGDGGSGETEIAALVEEDGATRGERGDATLRSSEPAAAPPPRERRRGREAGRGRPRGRLGARTGAGLALAGGVALVALVVGSMREASRDDAPLKVDEPIVEASVPREQGMVLRSPRRGAPDRSRGAEGGSEATETPPAEPRREREDSGTQEASQAPMALSPPPAATAPGFVAQAPAPAPAPSSPAPVAPAPPAAVSSTPPAGEFGP